MPGSICKQADPAEDKRVLLARYVLGSLGLGLGAGVFGRSLVGATEGVSPEPPPQELAQSSVPTLMPVVVPEQQSAKPLVKPRKKRVPMKLAALSRELAKDAGLDPARAIQGFMPDVSSDNPVLSPTGMPLVFSGATMGALGGWHLIDWLLKNRRKTELTDEVDAAKAQYEQELKHSVKAAALDAVYDKLHEKRATSLYDATIGGMGGGLTTAMLALALGTGYGTYQWAKKRTDPALLIKALEERAAMRRAPQPIIALPVSQRVKSKQLTDYDQATEEPV